MMTLNDSALEPIRIGLPVAEPIRLAGLVTIFDLPAEPGQAQLVPVTGTMRELMADTTLKYLVVDLQSELSDLEALETIRKVRPDMRSIVIGPQGNDALVISVIVAGARAYLDLTAGPEVVRKAIDVVTSGSIWAPRRLLSRLIDHLLHVPKVTSNNSETNLTKREQEVLELLLSAQSTREIAARLGIEQRTVKAYIGRLMRKTGADNRVKLSISALNRSLLSRTETER